MAKIRRGIVYQDGIVIGNIEDKENLKNPISRQLVKKFDDTLLGLLKSINPNSLHEIGCGEGRLTRLIASHFSIPILATDFSIEVIEHNQANEIADVTFVQKNIYELTAPEDYADVVICCEVLEHLANPENALTVLKKLKANHYVFSVPREPVWRFLNVFRGRYIPALGNTPGHINHWSTKSFLWFLKTNDFHVKIVKHPLPWIMVLGSFNP
jgi:2-polyprenyl-3-methyl-5-hydroxy-6-metoxy-1,4-benzoquinol methylase